MPAAATHGACSPPSACCRTCGLLWKRSAPKGAPPTLRSSLIWARLFGFSGAAGAAGAGAAGMRIEPAAFTIHVPSHTMLTSPAAATPDATSVDHTKLEVVKNIEGSACSSSSGVSCSGDLMRGGALLAAAAAGAAAGPLLPARRRLVVVRGAR
jgi:hypothetical protein